MMELAIFISLMITGVHAAFFEGMIFGRVSIKAATWLDYRFGKKASKYIQKPLWSCLPCMASVWTCLFTLSFDLYLILAVSGLNVIIERSFFKDDERPVES